MDFHFRCPQCGGDTMAPMEQMGKKLRCAKCGRLMPTKSPVPVSSMPTRTGSVRPVDQLETIQQVGQDGLSQQNPKAPTLALPRPSTRAKIASAGLQPGDHVGQYILKQELGRGGMAIVFLAEDTTLGRQVALKVILADLQEMDADAITRFRREAAAIAQLDHPHIVPIFELGDDERRRMPFFVMKFIRGRSLADLIADATKKRSHRLTDRRRLEIARDIAAGMAHAHQAGIIHRDLKPANILLGPGDHAYVTDFGLARLAKDGGTTDQPKPKQAATGSSNRVDINLTQAGMVLGTPAYMSPEQANGDQLGPPSDVYSLGAVLYELFTGHPSVTGNGQVAILSKVVLGQINPPHSRRPDLSPEIEAVILKAMALQPQDRYPTAASLVADLENILENRPITASKATWWRRAQKWVQRNRSLSVAASVIFVLVLSAGAIIWQQRGKARQEAAVQAAAERQAKIQSLLQEAKALQEQGEFSLSLEKCFGVLALDSNHEVALDLVRQAKSGLSVVESLAAGQRFLEEGEAEHKAGKITAAEAKFGIALGFFLAAAQAAPDNQEAKQKQLQAQGVGRLHLTSVPPGAEVTLTPLNMETLELLPTETRVVGHTPLVLDNLLPQEYSFVLRHPDYPEARFPVLLRRHEHAEILNWPLDVPKGMVFIPGGKFWMGDESSSQGLRPAQVDSFYLDRLEVTNAAYAQFTAATGHPVPSHWSASSPPREIWEYPISHLSWQDAAAYAQWAGKRLPTHEEWERAARGMDQRRFPFGNLFHQEVCRSGKLHNSPAPVGSHPGNASPYGVLDMSGNVVEWMGTKVNTPDGSNQYVWRGGGWSDTRPLMTSYYYGTYFADKAQPSFGLRCAQDAPVGNGGNQR